MPGVGGSEGAVGRPLPGAAGDLGLRWGAVAAAVPSDKGALALLLLLFTRLSDVYWPPEWPISLTQAAVAVGGIALLGGLLFRGRRLATDPILGWMLAYTATIALSALGAHDRVVPVLAAGTYLREVVIAFVLLNLIGTTAGLRRGTFTLIGAAALLAGAGAIQAVTGHGLGGLSTATMVPDVTMTAPTAQIIRLDGPFGVDSNYFAQLLLTVVPLALYRAWDDRHRAARVLALGAMLLSVAVIVRTLSRGGLLGLLLVLGVALSMRGVSRARLVPVGLALVVVLAVAPSLYWHRIGRTLAWVGETAAPGSIDWAGAILGPADDQLHERMALGLVGWTMFRDHSLTGVGKGNYSAMYPQYAPRVSPALPRAPLYPHNTPIHVAAETGILGLAAFAGVIVAGLAALRETKRRLSRNGLVCEAGLLEAIEVAIWGYLGTGMFLHENTYQRYLWLLIALAAVGRRVGLAAMASRPATPA
jgi:hypothetical protein